MVMSLNVYSCSKPSMIPIRSQVFLTKHHKLTQSLVSHKTTDVNPQIHTNSQTHTDTLAFPITQPLDTRPLIPYTIRVVKGVSHMMNTYQQLSQTIDKLQEQCKTVSVTVLPSQANSKRRKSVWGVASKAKGSSQVG